MKPFVPKHNFPILVTAGPTRERIDPVRFISNYSTGAFGYEIAKEAARRGYPVTLVSGPTALAAPKGVRFIGVESADEMRKAVLRRASRAKCVIMAAAVSDWKVKKASKIKIKRGKSGKVLELTQNPDILSELRQKRKKGILVGFALETEELEKNALKKMKRKNIDLIVANRLTKRPNVFGYNKTDILIIDRYGKKLSMVNKTKKAMAQIILDKALSFNI